MTGWATVGIVVLTAILTWIGHAVLAEQQRKLDIARALEQRKRDLYVEVLKLFFEVLKKGQKKESLKQDKLASEWIEITKNMAVYASDDVLHLFVQFRRMAFTENQDPKRFMDWFGKIIIQIRKDLGYSNTRIEPKDVLSLFITDIEKLY